MQWTSSGCAKRSTPARPSSGITAALARPEVACVLVPPDREDLLSLDLTELTYG